MEKRNRKGRTNNKFAMVVFLLIGLGLIICGVMMTLNRKQKDSYYGTVTGRITDVEHYTNSDDEDMYAAVYTYCVNDVPYTYTDSASSGKIPELGDIADIRYNPLHPNESYRAGKMWSGILIIGIGGVFILVSLLVFIYDRKSRQGVGRTPEDRKTVQYGADVQKKMVWDGNGAVKKGNSTSTLYFNKGQGKQNPYSGYVVQNSYDSEKVDGGELSQSDLYKDNTHQYGSHQGSKYQENTYNDNPVMDFYREHKQGIDTTIKTVQKGRNIYGCVIGVIAGAICVLSALIMAGASISHISAIKGGTTGNTLLPTYIIPIAMEGIFLAVGIFVIVKGIKGLLGK